MLQLFMEFNILNLIKYFYFDRGDNIYTLISICVIDLHFILETDSNSSRKLIGF